MNDELNFSLRRILEAIRIESPSTLIFANKRYETIPNSSMGVQQLYQDGNTLQTCMQNVLYSQCYTRKFRGKAVDEERKPEIKNDLMESLSIANAGKSRWENGWMVQSQFPTGQILAEKCSIVRMFLPGQFWFQGSGGTVQPGDSVSIFVDRESRHLQPGFYFAHGENLGNQADDAKGIRFYWNVLPKGAASLLRAVTTSFNRYAVPFRFKCICDTSLFDRIEPAVLFVARRHFKLATDLISQFYLQIQPVLGEDNPLFTKHLLPGLAIAEEPGTGESFGTHRCRILADSILKAFQQGCRTSDEKMDFIRSHFAENGVDLNQPHRNAGSSGWYEASHE
jgi:hypothetical protein